MHQEDITMVNIYVPNDRSPKYLKQKLRNEGINRQVINNSWDFNTPISIMDRISRQNQQRIRRL